MPEEEKEVDVLIIGGGPGGLTAAIYASRARRNTLVIDKVFPGGQLNYTAWIENFPSLVEGRVGMELAMQITDQAKKFDAVIKMEEAREIKTASDSFMVKTNKRTIRARVVIIASGASWKTLDVPGEMNLAGKGVSYCATCDAALFRDKEVVVVGGGDTALCEALFLTRFVKHLHLVHRRDGLRAEKILQERAFNNDKIYFIWDSIVTRITGDTKVEGIETKNKKTGETSNLSTEGVFIFVGNNPNTGFVPKKVKKNEQGQIITNLHMETNIPGMYAVGDVRSESIRQVVAAVGDGATAAWYADKHLDSLD